MSSLAPVIALAVEAARAAWSRACLACLRWAAREIDPLHPDRHVIEGRIAQLERAQCR